MSNKTLIVTTHSYQIGTFKVNLLQELMHGVSFIPYIHSHVPVYLQQGSSHQHQLLTWLLRRLPQRCHQHANAVFPVSCNGPCHGKRRTPRGITPPDQTQPRGSSEADNGSRCI